MNPKVKFALLAIFTLIIQAMCEVNLTVGSGDLICGSQVTLNCYVSPIADIRWERDTNLINNCLTTGICGFPDDALYSYSLSSSTYQLNISSVQYSTFNNNVFSCATGSESDSITFNISVPLRNITLSESTNQNNSTDLVVSTNCVKTSLSVQFQWKCISTDGSQTPTTCNVSNIISSADNTNCASGSDCSGSDITAKKETLRFVNDEATNRKSVFIVVNAPGVAEQTSTTTFYVQSSDCSGPSSCDCDLCCKIKLPSWICCILIILVVIIIICGTCIILWYFGCFNRLLEIIGCEYLFKKSSKYLDRIYTYKTKFNTSGTTSAKLFITLKGFRRQTDEIPVLGKKRSQKLEFDEAFDLSGFGLKGISEIKVRIDGLPRTETLHIKDIEIQIHAPSKPSQSKTYKFTTCWSVQQDSGEEDKIEKIFKEDSQEPRKGNEGKRSGHDQQGSRVSPAADGKRIDSDNKSNLSSSAVEMEPLTTGNSESYLSEFHDTCVENNKSTEKIRPTPQLPSEKNPLPGVGQQETSKTSKQLAGNQRQTRGLSANFTSDNNLPTSTSETVVHSVDETNKSDSTGPPSNRLEPIEYVPRPLPSKPKKKKRKNKDFDES